MRFLIQIMQLLKQLWKDYCNNSKKKYNFKARKKIPRFFYMEELIKRVLESETTKGKWRGNPSTKEWQEASRLNKVLTGVPLNSSANCECVEDLFFLLKRPNIHQKIEQNMEKRYRLKKGKLIQSVDFGHIGEASTDEQMKKALGRSPGLIKHFAVFPENWKEECGVKDELEDKGDKGGDDGNGIDPLYLARKEALMPFWDSLKEDHKSVDYSALSEEEFNIILKEAEESSKSDLGAGAEGDSDKGNEGDKGGSKKPTKEQLEKMKVSELKQFCIENKLELSDEISRKAEIIDFVLSKF